MINLLKKLNNNLEDLTKKTEPKEKVDLRRRGLVKAILTGGAVLAANPLINAAETANNILNTKKGYQIGAYKLGMEKELFYALKKEFGNDLILTRKQDGLTRVILQYAPTQKQEQTSQRLKKIEQELKQVGQSHSLKGFNAQFKTSDKILEEQFVPVKGRNYVQIGALGNKEYLNELIGNLRKINQRNIVFDKASVGGKELYTVLIGPYNKEDQGIKDTEDLFKEKAQTKGVRLNEMWTVTYKERNGNLEKEWLSLLKNEVKPITATKKQIQKKKVVTIVETKTATKIRRIKVTTPVFKIIDLKSKKYKLDSDLVSAIIHEESHFNPNRRAFKVRPKRVNGVTKFVYRKNSKGQRIESARGLMMISPDLAKDFGVKYGSNLFDPTTSIELGTRNLRDTTNSFSGETYRPISHLKSGYHFAKGKSYSLSKDAALKAAVAAYNCGKGIIYVSRNKKGKATNHIRQFSGVRRAVAKAIVDIRNKKLDRTTIEFDDIKKYLPSETQRYVSRVMQQYSKLKN